MEATEVWFTDYGFGALAGDRVWVPLDPTFAGTVNTDEGYRVFLQSYGPADLYVAERSCFGGEWPILSRRPRLSAPAPGLAAAGKHKHDRGSSPTGLSGSCPTAPRSGW